MNTLGQKKARKISVSLANAVLEHCEATSRHGDTCKCITEILRPDSRLDIEVDRVRHTTPALRTTMRKHARQWLREAGAEIDCDKPQRHTGFVLSGTRKRRKR